jgi:hypothetical protein
MGDRPIMQAENFFLKSLQKNADFNRDHAVMLKFRGYWFKENVTAP